LSVPARSSLRAARAKLTELCVDAPLAAPQYEQVTVQRKGAHLALSGVFRVRRDGNTSPGRSTLERADIHSLLLPGMLSIRCSGATLAIDDSQLFLDTERLLAMAEELWRASCGGQPVFRRVQLSQARITARLGPGR